MSVVQNPTFSAGLAGAAGAAGAAGTADTGFSFSHMFTPSDPNKEIVGFGSKRRPGALPPSFDAGKRLHYKSLDASHQVDAALGDPPACNEHKCKEFINAVRKVIAMNKALRFIKIVKDSILTEGLYSSRQFTKKFNQSISNFPPFQILDNINEGAGHLVSNVGIIMRFVRGVVRGGAAAIAGSQYEKMEDIVISISNDMSSNSLLNNFDNNLQKIRDVVSEKVEQWKRDNSFVTPVASVDKTKDPFDVIENLMEKYTGQVVECGHCVKESLNSEEQASIDKIINSASESEMNKRRKRPKPVNSASESESEMKRRKRRGGSGSKRRSKRKPRKSKKLSRRRKSRKSNRRK